MDRLLRTTLLLLPALWFAACDGPGSENRFSIEGTGAVNGLTFLDLSRSGPSIGSNPPISNLGVALVMEGTLDTVARGVSDARGELVFRDVAPGSYRVVPEPGLLGDSLGLSTLTPFLLQVTPLRESAFTLGVSFPVRTIEEIRDGAEGRRVFVEGIALNAYGTLLDGALHVWDGQRAIRTLVPAGVGVVPGDSVRILGRSRRVQGQMRLEAGLGQRLREGLAEPLPIDVSTAEAANARSGALDAALVRVRSGVIADTATSFGRLTLSVSDGSGPLSVQFPGNFLFDAEIAGLSPGMVMDLTGVLIPETSTTWRLYPRTFRDLTLIPTTPPPVSSPEGA